MTSIGHPDPPSVLPGGARAAAPNIEGVRFIELGNVITRSGFLTEVFRADFFQTDLAVRNVIWVQLNPGAVTDWHRHLNQTDRLVGVGGPMKLALWDGREHSATRGATDVVRFGALRPLLVIVPPGVWHALRNESGAPAGYLNITDGLYDYKQPDNWRVGAGEVNIPDIL